jgi:hypothetical protein
MTRREVIVIYFEILSRNLPRRTEENHEEPRSGESVPSPLWSSGQSSWLQIQRSRVKFPALPDFLRSK